MKSIFETKDTAAGMAPLDVSLTSGEVKVVWNTMDVEDYDEDVMDGACFNKTIAERGPSGSNLICGLIDHYPSIEKLYGKPRELSVQGGRLVAVIPVLKTRLGQDLIIQYDGGIINQQSVGFATMREETMANGKRLIKEAKLYEGSAVLWGANWLTETLDVVRNKSNGIDILKNREAQVRQLLKLSGMTDETYMLNEIRMKQLQQAIEVFTKNITDTTCPDCGEEMEDGICTNCEKQKKIKSNIQKFLSSLS